MPYGLTILTFIAIGIFGKHWKPVTDLLNSPLTSSTWVAWAAVAVAIFGFWCAVVRAFGGGRYTGE